MMCARLTTNVGVAAVLCIIFAATSTTHAETTVQLPPLPYPYNALEPMISQRTLEIHHDKHHAKYVNTVNSMVKGTDLETASLETIILTAFETKNQGLFNNAAQSWNHAFYWNCMSPKGGGGGEPPKGSKLSELIKSSFGSFDEFKKQFATAGNTAFGSGWAWLVFSKGGKLAVTKTIGADNPMTDANTTPILTMDVWEHAYYLDYQNMRNTYVDTFLDKLVNWKFVADNLEQAMAADGSKAEL